ncbi:MAG: AI-2E family transporter [Armatimonadota bacterium]|nr:AI-2E family transporter [Armatimonadota bacterium]
MVLLPSRLQLVIATAVVTATVLLVLGLAWLLWFVGEIILVVLIAAILATGLNPVVEAVGRRAWTRRRRRLSRGASVAVVYLGLLAALGLMGSLFVGPMVNESREFIERAPALYAGLLQMLAEWRQRYPWLPDLTAVLDRLPQEAGVLTSYVGAATGVAFRVFGAVVSAVTVLIVSIYMLLEAAEIRAGFLRLFPPARHAQVESVLRGIGLKFGGWLRGQLFLGFVVGLAAGLGTWILGLPYPFLLGLAAGVTELVPMIGPVLGAIPAVFVALFGPVWRLIAVVILFAGIQQLENNVLVPRVMKQTVGLSPLLTIVAIMVGAKLMGVLGALLAVPMAAVLQVIIGEVLQTLWREKIGTG